MEVYTNVALSNIWHTPGIHVAWTLGNQHDGKALPGRRSCCRRRSMVQGVAGRNKSLACCFCWPPSSDIVTGFRCPSSPLSAGHLDALKRFIGFSINPGRTRNGGLAPHTCSLSSTPSEFAGVSRQGHFSYYLIRLIVLRSWWRQALRHSREGDSLSLITLERDIQTRSLNFTLTPLQHKYLKAPFYHRNLFQLHNQQWIILLYILL